MWLPVPTEDSVLKFQKHAKDEFGLDLDAHEALDAATRLLQLVYCLGLNGIVPKALREAMAHEGTVPLTRRSPRET